MSLFGFLLGWDKSMAAVNVLMASHLIEKAALDERQNIAIEVAKIIASVKRGMTTETILASISQEIRAVQMGFIALACDNLGIPPPIKNNVWTRVDNPYRSGRKIDANLISATVDAFKKQDGIHVTWPGNDASIDFAAMFHTGLTHSSSISQNSNDPLDELSQDYSDDLQQRFKKAREDAAKFVIKERIVFSTPAAASKAFLRSQDALKVDKATNDVDSISTRKKSET